jgi:hypothetical protein
VGGAVIVIHAGAAYGVGRVDGVTWGTTKVMGAAPGGATEVGEAGDEAVSPVLVVRGPRVAV